MLSGRIFDPFAVGQNEALARSEATQRASTANQIARAGFSGTGVGKQIGGATDQQILSNRFASNIALEQAKNTEKAAAMGTAQNYATAEQTAKMNAQTMAQNATAAAGANFAAYTQSHTNTQSDPEGSYNSDPALQKLAQAQWEALGNTGAVPKEWAVNQIKAVNDPKLNDAKVAASSAIDNEVAQGIITKEQGDAMKWAANVGIFDYMKKDDKGNYTFDSDAYNRAMGITPKAGGATGYDPTTSDPFSKEANAVIAAGTSDPNYRAVLKAQTDLVVNNNPASVDMTQLKGLTSDSPLYKSVLQKMPIDNFSTVWHKPKGTTVRVNIGGQDLVLKMVDAHSEGTYGEEKFTDADGHTVYLNNQGGYRFAA
jgi:hypothetical protein